MQLETLRAPSANFDAAFLKAQEAAHLESIALYKTAALKGSRPVRLDAIKALPVLGMHLGAMLQLQGGHAVH